MKTLFVLSLVVLLAGCATPYQSQGLRGGLRVSQVDSDVFTISFTGNAYTQNQRAYDFVLLRAAELAIDHGMTHFSMMSNQMETRSTVASMPVYGYAGGGDYGFQQRTYTQHRPTAMLMVRIHNDETSEMALDANMVAANIRAQYGIEPPVSEIQ